MLKGETIQNYTIQREDATTIENNNKIISEQSKMDLTTI